MSSNQSKSDLSLPTRQAFADSCLPQEFSFPLTIIRYIWNNPKTTKCYLKFIQTCKLLFIKNSIIIVDSLFFTKNYGWSLSFNRKDVRISQLNNLICKFWFIKEINITEVKKEDMDFLFSKIFQCEIIKIDMYNLSMKYEQFKVFGKSTKTAVLREIYVKNDDGLDVSFIKLFEVLLKIEDLSYFCFNAPIPPDTAQLLIQIPHFVNIKSFTLDNIGDGFDIEIFDNFLKEHKFHAEIMLYFRNPNMPQEYQIRLVKFIEKIIQKNLFSFEYAPAKIKFEEMDEDLEGKLNLIANYKLKKPRTLQYVKRFLQPQ